MEENKASRTFLVVAVVFGIIATVMAFWFLNSIAGTDRGPTVKILVAAHDLRPNVSLDPEKDFREETIPAKYKLFFESGLDAASKGNYKGAKLNKFVRAGQPILLADFGVGGELEWPAANSRKLTIRADMSDASFVIPGDYVQVMSPTGEYLVGGQHFKVVAVGGAMKVSRAVMASEQSNSGGSAKSVTLELTEKQASDLVKAMGLAPEKCRLVEAPPPEETTRPAP